MTEELLRGMQAHMKDAAEEDGDPEIGEGILIAFFPRMLRRLGWDAASGVTLSLRRNNLKDEFAPDWALCRNQMPIGVIDPETKGEEVARLFDTNCDWPITVPRWTMRYHTKTSDNRVETNKIRAFRQFPHTSFWVGIRHDYRVATILLASDILNAPIVEKERKGYPMPLTLFEVPRNLACFWDIASQAGEEFILEKLQEGDHD